MTEYLHRKFQSEYRIVDFYVDDGLSGTDDSRAGFMRMIADVENGKVNCIICKTLSRAFRNYSDQGYYLEYYFLHKNIRFLSAGDPEIDTFLHPEAVTGLEVPITGLMNDRYAARTSSDIRRTFDTKRRNGEFIGAFAPYGYLKHPKDKNRLIIDEEAAPIKREVLLWIIKDGMSLSGAAKKLNRMGVPNPTLYKQSKGLNYHNPHAKDNDGLWTGTTLKRVLLDQVNLGHMVQGKQRVVSYKVHNKISVPKHEWYVKHNTHEAIFTPEEYNTLERLLMRDTRTPNGEGKLHLFSGFLRCFDCKKAMHRKSAKGNVYYACRTYTEKSDQACKRHSIRLDVLENAVLAAIKAQIALIDLDLDMVRMAKENVVGIQSKSIERMIQDKQKERSRLCTISDGLYMDWKCGEINDEDYHRIKNKIELQKENIQISISNLKEEQTLKNQSKKNSERDLLNEWLYHNNICRLNRGLLAQLVDTIYIHEQNEITIHFRFTDQIKRIYKDMDMDNEKE